MWSAGGSEEEDDREWYRQEVGEEPDPGEVSCDCHMRSGDPALSLRHTGSRWGA